MRSLSPMPLAVSLVVAASLAGCATSRPSEPGTFVEKTVAAPHETRIPVDISHERATLTWVEAHNTPTAQDSSNAAAKDPEDKSIVLIRFYYRNDGYTSHKVKIRTILLDANGGVLADAGRSGTLDAQKTEDTLTYPMTVRTVDWPKGTQLKILVTFLD